MIDSIVDIPLSAGATIISQDASGSTAAHWAYAMGHKKLGDLVVQKCRDEQIDIEALQDNDGRNVQWWRDQIKEEEIESIVADPEIKVDVQPESTETEAELRKEEISEDSKEIIENKDDPQIDEFADKIEANTDFETNSENEAVADTKKSETKEKPELEAEVESDAS